jgi:hypothetical protein
VTALFLGLFGIVQPALAQNASGAFQYLGSRASAVYATSTAVSFDALRSAADKISDADLSKIPLWNSTSTGDIFIRSKYAGHFVYTASDTTHVWFVSPGDLRRYYFDGSDASFQFLEQFDPKFDQRNIVVTLSNQQLQEKFGDLTLATFTVSSGKPGHATPKGTFHILAKSPRAWSHLASLWMPWWMEFTKVGDGIHELPEWPNGTKEGANHLGKPVSHGCVRLGVGPAQQIYNWASVGTPVTVAQ